jgi:soluble lytic murein transglycosylase-like protein
MACKFDLREKIIAEANDQGVPPEIALAVATQESNLCHWAPNGNVLRGAAGEYGVMQLMPATASSLGVDPTDVDQNIHGGVKFLRQLYDKYGDWGLAVQHYNGSGPAAQTYAQKVLAIADRYGLALNVANGGNSGSLNAGVAQPPAAVTPIFSKNLLIGAGIVAGAGILGFVVAG